MYMYLKTIAIACVLILLLLKLWYFYLLNSMRTFIALGKNLDMVCSEWPGMHKHD